MYEEAKGRESHKAQAAEEESENRSVCEEQENEEREEVEAMKRPQSMIPSREIIPGELPGSGVGKKIWVILKLVTLVIPLLVGAYQGVKAAVEGVSDAFGKDSK
jgi:hypothetical protein